MVTIRQIAQTAGVSPATVSLVLNNSPRVSEQTTLLVQKALQTLGYEPRHAGRPRKGDAPTRSRYRIAFVSGYALARFKHALLYLDVLDGINAALAGEQTTSQFVHVDPKLPLPAEIMQRQFDGIVVLGPELLRVIKALEPAIPFVQVMGPEVFNADWDQVTCNNTMTGELAARYLIEHGHRHLAVLAVDDDIKPHDIRNKAFMDYAQAHGLKVRINTPIKLTRDVPMHQQLLTPLKQLFKGASRPTALYSSADMYTVAAHPALSNIGLTPGKDVLIASSNHETNIFAALDPQPVSVDLNPYEIGFRAAMTLLRRIQSPQVPYSLQMISPVLKELNAN